jgi:hypothetical protein
VSDLSKLVKNGGPAFPMNEAAFYPGEDIIRGHQNGPSTSSWEGMSLRDYFAAKAMQACLEGVSDNGRLLTRQHMSFYAESFYAMADAMLEARK